MNLPQEMPINVHAASFSRCRKVVEFNEKKEKQKYENNPLSRNTRFLFAKTNRMKSTLRYYIAEDLIVVLLPNKE